MSKFSKKRHDYRASNFWTGFTLVELLTVMSIIAVLASLALLVGNEARERARYARAVLALEDIALGDKNLGVETDLRIGKYPVSDICGNSTNEPLVKDDQSWTGVDWTRGQEFPLIGRFDGTTYGSGPDFTKVAGLADADTDYKGWSGPYMTNLIDPWGNPYWFDPDYSCRYVATDKAPRGCEKWTELGLVYRAIYSRGPHAKSGFTDYESDNVVRVLCRNTCEDPPACTSFDE